MTMIEALQRCVERPDLKACLAGRHVIEVSSTGRLMDIALAARSYCRLTVNDCLAITWQVFTQEQLMQLVDETERAMRDDGGR